MVKDVMKDMDGSTHVRYNRTYNGLRVIGGDLVSHRDSSGKIRSVNWNGSQQVSVASTTPKISLLSARTAGLRKASVAQRTSSASKGELVVYSSGASTKAPPKLAYDVLTEGVRADQTPSRLHTIVDAGNGAILSSFDEIKNGTGNGIYVGVVPIDTTDNVGSYSMSDATGNTTTDLNGLGDGTGDDLFYLPGTTFTDADNIWGNGTISDRASAGVDAHYGAEQTYGYFKNVLERIGIRNDGVGARSRVHYGYNYANAFWDGTQVTYGDGAGNSRPLVGLDIAGHELTHGITENTADLVYTGEAGGLNEATSDIFGTAVEFYANNPADTPDYLVGEKLDLNGNGTPLRFMDRPSRDGVSPDCWSPTVPALDVHLSSGPLNHWFYLTSEGSGAKVINGVSYDSPTCNASSVTGIGHEKAAKIWYRTLSTYLTSSNSYAAAREGAIQSAKDLYGASSPECASVAASFSAIAVPPGAVTCAMPPPPPLGSNVLSNQGFESGNTLWSATREVIGQWAPEQPARTGTWSAWLGGYGVFNDDSISQMVTVPATGRSTLSYYAHIETAELPGSLAYDTMTVRAGSTVLQRLSNLDAASGYQIRTVSLSAYAGQTIAISFSGSEDEAASTSFVLDDISVISPVAPGVPTGVRATAGNTQAALTWAAPTRDGGSPVTGYKIIAVPGGRTATTTGARSATVTGLTNGQLYRFQVLAINAAGSSAYSVLSAAVRPDVVPGAPRIGWVTASNATATVRWSAPAANGGTARTGYRVRVVNSAYATVGVLRPAVAGASSLVVSGLRNGQLYRFQVLAVNAAGSGAYTALSSVVRPNVVPVAPRIGWVTAGNARATVRWSAPAANGGTARTGYLVRVVNSAYATVGVLRPAAAGATSLVVYGLRNGLRYRFQVLAVNLAGRGAYSALSNAVIPK